MTDLQLQVLQLLASGHSTFAITNLINVNTGSTLDYLQSEKLIDRNLAVTFTGHAALLTETLRRNGPRTLEILEVSTGIDRTTLGIILHHLRMRSQIIYNTADRTYRLRKDEMTNLQFKILQILEDVDNRQGAISFDAIYDLIPDTIPQVPYKAIRTLHDLGFATADRDTVWITPKGREYLLDHKTPRTDPSKVKLATEFLERGDARGALAVLKGKARNDIPDPKKWTWVGNGKYDCKSPGCPAVNGIKHQCPPSDRVVRKYSVPIPVPRESQILAALQSGPQAHRDLIEKGYDALIERTLIEMQYKGWIYDVTEFTDAGAVRFWSLTDAGRALAPKPTPLERKILEALRDGTTPHPDLRTLDIEPTLQEMKRKGWISNWYEHKKGKIPVSGWRLTNTGRAMLPGSWFYMSTPKTKTETWAHKRFMAVDDPTTERQVLTILNRPGILTYEEIGKGVGRDVPHVRQVLRSLQEHGWIQENDRGGYSVTPAGLQELKSTSSYPSPYGSKFEFLHARGYSRIELRIQNALAKGPLRFSQLLDAVGGDPTKLEHVLSYLMDSGQVAYNDGKYQNIVTVMKSEAMGATESTIVTKAAQLGHTQTTMNGFLVHEAHHSVLMEALNRNPNDAHLFGNPIAAEVDELKESASPNDRNELLDVINYAAEAILSIDEEN